MKEMKTRKDVTEMIKKVFQSKVQKEHNSCWYCIWGGLVLATKMP